MFKTTTGTTKSWSMIVGIYEFSPTLLKRLDNYTVTTKVYCNRTKEMTDYQHTGKPAKITKQVHRRANNGVEFGEHNGSK